jgi:hypothetical protein
LRGRLDTLDAMTLVPGEPFTSCGIEVEAQRSRSDRVDTPTTGIQKGRQRPRRV